MSTNIYALRLISRRQEG